MQFGTSYYHPFDRKYDQVGDIAANPRVYNADIEKPLMPISEIAQSVTEGNRFGSFVQTVTGAIRTGGGSIELQPQLGGGAEPTGVESYGKEARQALREMARANKVNLSAVHTPSQIGNLSGLGQEGFSDQQRLSSLEEVKKAISFAGDVTGGGAVVVHTGEFQRPISDQKWALMRDERGQLMKDQRGNPIYQFVGYQEEPGRAIYYMVDDRNGRLIQSVQKSQVVFEPLYKTAESEGLVGKRDPQTGRVLQADDYIDIEGHWIDERNPDNLFKRVPEWNPAESRFKTERRTWDYYEGKAKRWEEKYPDQPPRKPEEMFYRAQMENQMLQHRGLSLYHARQYESSFKDYGKARKALEFYKRLEESTDPEERWKLEKQMGSEFGGLIPPDVKLPSAWLEEYIKNSEHNLRHTHESSAANDAQADTIRESLDHIKPVEKYATEQSLKSYAEAGIMAMQETEHNPNVKRDIFVAPENIFPEMGYGSHPQELIELVRGARQKMVEYLTSKRINDPHGRRDDKGELIKIDNPWYQQRFKENLSLAWKEAESHIKATFDTQHLGMWRKHFQPKFIANEGRIETEAETNKRFNQWYMGQVEDLQKSGVLGHLHIVDSMGSSHQHLPAGQGIFPVVDAITYLRNKGFTGTMTSEAWAEEQHAVGRILTATWRAFGNTVQGYGAPPPRDKWSDVQHSYFGRTYPPYFIFGAYAPSNDWQLWSTVPME